MGRSVKSRRCRTSNPDDAERAQANAECGLREARIAAARDVRDAQRALREARADHARSLRDLQNAEAEKEEWSC